MDSGTIAALDPHRTPRIPSRYTQRSARATLFPPFTLTLTLASAVLLGMLAIAGCGKVSIRELAPPLAPPVIQAIVPAAADYDHDHGPSAELQTPSQEQIAVLRSRFQILQSDWNQIRGVTPNAQTQTQIHASPQNPGATPDPADWLRYHPQAAEALARYNRHLEEFLRACQGPEACFHASWITRMHMLGVPVTIKRNGSCWNPELMNEFHFASDFQVKKINTYYQSPGLGVPMFAVRSHADKNRKNRQGQERFFPNRQVYGMTAVLRFAGDPASGGTSAILELNDTLITDETPAPSVAQTQTQTTETLWPITETNPYTPDSASASASHETRIPLATDYSTPLAFQALTGQLSVYQRLGLFRPQEVDNIAGLHLLHPYEPGKIPVVLIHGLGSGPATWLQVLNTLRGEPEMRKHYQIWVFTYPTGNPFSLSAAELRRDLYEIQQVLDPSHSDPAMRQMVLIGHSMGGLLTRLAVTSSGDALWKNASSQPFEALRGKPEQKELLRSAMFFDALPFVRRAVFIATPHRGSRLGSQLIGRVFDGLIQLPNDLDEAYNELLEQNPPDFFTKRYSNGLPSSINLLRTDTPLLNTLDTLPIAPWVRCDSIIGQLVPGPKELGTDGVVAYKSSHISQVTTETIVPSSHFCLDIPKTIAQIQKLLREHYQQYQASLTAR